MRQKDKLNSDQYFEIEKFILSHSDITPEKRFSIAQKRGYISNKGFWKHRIKLLKKVMLSAESFLQAVEILKKEYAIETTTSILKTMCSTYRIPRPKISGKWGGERRGNVRRNKKTNT